MNSFIASSLLFLRLNSSVFGAHQLYPLRRAQYLYLFLGEKSFVSYTIKLKCEWFCIWAAKRMRF